MAVQQLGRDQARTLTDIIRGLSNVGGGIDEALQVVPGLGSATPATLATPATSVTKQKITAYDPAADYGLDSEMSGNIDIEGDNVTQSFGKDVGTLGDIIGSIFQYQGPGSQSFERELAAQKPQFVKPQINQMTEQEILEMEADERVNIDDQLKALSDSFKSGVTGDPEFVPPPPATKDSGTTTSEFQSGVRDTPEFGVGNLPTKDEQDNILEETFAKSMKDYLDALKGEDTDVKSIEEYKKEFADATGISIDGKPDKSAALMSFGLALMQNKAGKGFNIGRMLSAVGEAGEKAMPAFQQAKKEAKAEQLAAGKYALDSRAAAITKAAATRQAIADRAAELSDRAFERETQVQVEKLKQDGQNLRKEAELLATEQRKAVEDAEKAGELSAPRDVLIGGTNRDLFKVQGQQVGKSDVFKIVNAEGAMNTVEGQIKLASQGLDTAKRMRQIAASGDISGGKNLFNSFKLGFEGIISVPFDETKAKNPQAEYKAAVGSMLVQFRRMLTGGEAGNAISDRDVDIIKENLGYLENFLSGNITTSSQEIVSRVDQLVGMFENKLEQHSNMKKDLIRMGQKAGQYQEYDLAKDSDFTDDFEGYSLKVMPNGRVRYSLVDKG